MEFNYALEEFLLNVFFIMFPLLFYQFTIDEKLRERTLLKSVVTFLFFGIPMILCMIFPIVDQNHFIFDLRLIPLILAFLYSNWITSILLLLTAVLTRFIIDVDTGAYLSLVTNTVALLLTMIIVRRYPYLSMVKKIFACSFISIISKTISKLPLLFMTSTLNFQFPSAIKFYLVQSLFLGLAIYVLESIRKNAQLQKEIIDSEKMKVVSVMSASVAHEIRNPLTAVRGFIQLLDQTELYADKKKMYVKICLEELDRAQEIINDYLSLAKPHQENIEKLNIGEELVYVSHVLSSYANLKNVEVLTQVEPNLSVLGDRQKFRQSILNIAKNGIEVIGEQGGVLKLGAIEHKNNVVISINDTGSGMTPDQIRRLGTPYFSNKEKGTGLGTMVAFNFIKGMNGKVEIKSQVGVGTEFNILFPRAF
jgi:two-component system sporulation sensor kinase B